eukprot:11222197-Lingulodinium_polyedra.AAC.1
MKPTVQLLTPRLSFEDGEAPLGPSGCVVPDAPAAGQGPDLGAVPILDRAVIGFGGQEFGKQPEMVLQSGHKVAVGARVPQ